MILAVLAALAIPTAAMLAGRGAATRLPRPSLPAAVVMGALAPPAVVAFYERTFVEQTTAWVVGLVGWGGLFLAHDPYVLAAAMLAGGTWGGILALPTGSTQASSAALEGAPTARPAPSPRAEEPVEEEIRIALPCPSCGAPVTFPIYHGMAECRYCASRHLVQREDTTLFTVIPNTVTHEAGIASAVITHLRHLKYLELYDRRVRPLVQQRAAQQATASQDEALVGLEGVTLAAINAAEASVNRAADDYAARLEPHIQVLSWQPFLAPYWHRSGTLYQVAFGRQEDGEKKMELAITHLEGSQPGSSLPLPEMGKLSYLRCLRPLLGAPEATIPALPVEGGQAELARRLETQEDRRASFPFRTISVRGAFVPEVDALVWRPFHAARVSVRGDVREFLIDGASGRVTRDAPPPLATLAESPPPPAEDQIRLLPSRCPVCGAELKFIPDAVAHLCRNCFRLLEATPRRLRPRPYLREDPGAGLVAVPFWRFPLALRTAEGEIIRDLDHLGDRLDGTLDQVGDRPQRQSYLFVPAFRLRLSRGAVRLYRRLWPILHVTTREPKGEPFDTTAAPAATWPLTLPASEARTFGAMYLALSFSSRDLARAEIRGVRSRFLDATLEGEPEPVYLSLPKELVSPFEGLLRASHAAAVARLAGR
ncbi:MAG: hypothetical protein HRF46_02475 [Acidobacteriota bacterium]|mgnify:CR=1 FL=1|jgi:ribosomal protein S14/DNA-directed RNA polymerase subunit RPC12/RpoP